MKNYLIRIKTFGIKNINEKVGIDFNNNTISLMKNPSKIIRAIFGLNGSGKSALINSVSLYKRILIKNNFLSNDSDIKLLKNILNNEIKQFYFKMFFVSENDNKKNIYSHEITLRLINDEVIIENEKLDIIKGQTINSSDIKNIYTVTNGELIIDETYIIDKLIKEKTLNLLNKSSLISIMLSKNIKDTIATFNGNQTHSDLYADSILIINSMNVINTVFNIYSYLDGDDNFDIDENFFYSFDSSINNFFHISYCNYEDIINKDDITKYENDLKRKTNFIKIFKPDLKNINIVKKEDEQFFKIRKEFDYGKYSVDLEFESTGIKKLIIIFEYINQAFKGKTVFIDEMDANINGIFLNKLIEYFLESGKGILCFTAHNYEPMNYLKNQKGAILLLGETGKLVILPRYGNTNPINFYKEGMVEDSPFNFESYDFANIFSED